MRSEAEIREMHDKLEAIADYGVKTGDVPPGETVGVILGLGWALELDQREGALPPTQIDLIRTVWDRLQAKKQAANQ